MRVKRVIGNNAVVAVDDDGHEVVALGRGVGHGRRPNDLVDTNRVEQVFIAGGAAAGDRLTEFLADTPLSCVRTAARIAELAHERLGLRVTQALILPIADHLTFAMHRYRQGISMDFPLVWEVGQLYPRELEVGRAAVTLADTILSIKLDPDEAVAFAMHFVNAQFATPGLSTTVRMTETITRMFDVVERTFGLTIDRQSMTAARFVTHLRYLFTRISSGKQIHESHRTLVDAIANAHPDAMVCAAKLQYFIEMSQSTHLTPDETAYLAMHVARLVTDVRSQLPT